MDLHNSDETHIQVVSFGFSGVQDLNWEGSSWDGEDGGFEEILGELDGIQRGRGHYQLHVFAFLYSLKKGHFKKNQVTDCSFSIILLLEDCL